MNAGLAQGFVRFGAVPHLILVLLHQHGELRHLDLVEETGAHPSVVAMSLLRLHRHGFIFPAGMAPCYETGDKTQRRWSLVPPARVKRYRPASVNERKARSRAMTRHRVPSVWEFRP